MERPRRILDEGLQGMDVRVGDRLGVAGLNVGHGRFWVTAAGVDLGEYPKREGWLARLADRSALQKAWGGKRPAMILKDRRPEGEVDPRRGF